MTQKTRAIVLHVRPFKETSLIVDCFTEDMGRASFLAKGARRSTKQSLRAILQLSSEIDVFFSGRSELKTLHDAEFISASKPFVGQGYACAIYLVELILKTLQSNDANVRLYSEIKNTFNELYLGASFAMTLRRFEAILIQEMGLSIEFEYDIEGEPIEDKLYYELVADYGFKKTERVNEGAISGENVARLNQLEIESDSYLLKYCKWMHRVILGQYVDFSDFNSRDLWKQWKLN